MKAPCTILLAAALVVAAVGRGIAEKEKAPDYSKKTLAQWIEALKDQDIEKSAEAHEALGPNGPYAKSAIPALIDALNHKEKFIQLTAIETLADYGPDVVPDLVRALKRPEPLIREGTLDTINEVSPRSNDALDAAIASIKDTVPDVRRAAARCLGTIGRRSDKAIAALVVALQDEKHGVRFKAAESLKNIGVKGASAVPALSLGVRGYWACCQGCRSGTN
jgi:HEAT repeat protein